MYVILFYRYAGAGNYLDKFKENVRRGRFVEDSCKKEHVLGTLTRNEIHHVNGRVSDLSRIIENDIQNHIIASQNVNSLIHQNIHGQPFTKPVISPFASKANSTYSSQSIQLNPLQKKHIEIDLIVRTEDDDGQHLKRHIKKGPLKFRKKLGYKKQLIGNRQDNLSNKIKIKTKPSRHSIRKRCISADTVNSSESVGDLCRTKRLVNHDNDDDDDDDDDVNGDDEDDNDHDEDHNDDDNNVNNALSTLSKRSTVHLGKSSHHKIKHNGKYLQSINSKITSPIVNTIASIVNKLDDIKKRKMLQKTDIPLSLNNTQKSKMLKRTGAASEINNTKILKDIKANINETEKIKVSDQIIKRRRTPATVSRTNDSTRGVERIRTLINENEQLLQKAQHTNLSKSEIESEVDKFISITTSVKIKPHVKMAVEHKKKSGVKEKSNILAKDSLPTSKSEKTLNESNLPTKNMTAFRNETNRISDEFKLHRRKKQHKFKVAKNNSKYISNKPSSLIVNNTNLSNKRPVPSSMGGGKSSSKQRPVLSSMGAVKSSSKQTADVNAVNYLKNVVVKLRHFNRPNDGDNEDDLDKELNHFAALSSLELHKDKNQYRGTTKESTVPSHHPENNQRKDSIAGKRTFENGLDDPFIASYDDDALIKMRPITNTQASSPKVNNDYNLPNADAPDAEEMESLNKFYEKDLSDTNNVFADLSSATHPDTASSKIKQVSLQDSHHTENLPVIPINQMDHIRSKSNEMKGVSSFPERITGSQQGVYPDIKPNNAFHRPEVTEVPKMYFNDAEKQNNGKDKGVVNKLFENDEKKVYESDLLNAEKHYSAITPVGHPVSMVPPIGHPQEMVNNEKVFTISDGKKEGYGKKYRFGIDEGEMKESNEAAKMEEYQFDSLFPLGHNMKTDVSAFRSSKENVQNNALLSKQYDNMVLSQVKARPFEDHSDYVDKDLKLSDEWMREAEELHNAKGGSIMPDQRMDGIGRNNSVNGNMMTNENKLNIEKYGDFLHDKYLSKYENPMGESMGLEGNKNRGRLLETTLRDEAKLLKFKDEGPTSATQTIATIKTKNPIDVADIIDSKAKEDEQSAVLSDPNFTHASLLEMNIVDGTKQKEVNNSKGKEKAVVVSSLSDKTTPEGTITVDKEQTDAATKELQETASNLVEQHIAIDAPFKSNNTKGIQGNPGVKVSLKSHKEKHRDGESSKVSTNEDTKALQEKLGLDVPSQSDTKEDTKLLQEKLGIDTPTDSDTKENSSDTAKVSGKPIVKEFTGSRQRDSSHDGKLHIFVGDGRGKSLHEIEGTEVIKEMKPMQSKFHASTEDNIVDDDLGLKDKQNGEKLLIETTTSVDSDTAMKPQTKIHRKNERRKAAITNYKLSDANDNYATRPNSMLNHFLLISYFSFKIT